MKKIFLILDGMADRDQAVLGGKTPIEYADMKNLNSIFQKSKCGLIKNIPDGEETGSAVANLNLLGFNTKKEYKGRAVIEAAGAELPIDQESLYIRCNFVTLKGDTYEDSIIESYSAHEIETEVSLPLVKRLNDEVFGGDFELKSTGSFRNVLECKGKTYLLGKLNFMPPHDIIGKKISDYMDITDESKPYFEFMKKSYEVLKKGNDTKANAIWFWGVSKSPSLYDEKNKSTHILCETILMKGIANLMGAKKTVTSEDQGFVKFLEHKKENAIKAVKSDAKFIYVHIQAPDDLSHELLTLEKSEALSQIDELFIKGFLEGIKDEDYTLLITSDHFTFSDDGSHGGDPTPFLLYQNNHPQENKCNYFSEKSCKTSDYLVTAHELHEILK